MSTQSTARDLIRRRNIVGNVMIEDGMWSDNLGIALICYFSHHEDCPEPDDLDPETGHGKWALQKANEALDLIAAEIFTEAKGESK